MSGDLMGSEMIYLALPMFLKANAERCFIQQYSKSSIHDGVINLNAK